MAVMKDMGWTISVNPVSGRISVYRQGMPGSIEIPYVDGALTARIVDENDHVVDMMTANTKHLEFKNADRQTA